MGLRNRILKPLWAVFRDTLPPYAHVVVDQVRIHGRWPNLKDPATFSEKIARRMLYDRDERIPALVDKVAAKRTMASRFGEQFVIPTLGVFDSAAEIDFALLEYPCVIKPNHASGFNVFLKERPLGEVKVRRRLSGLLKYRHERSAEEWAYSQIAPRLLVEPFLGGESGLVDYKFHTFGERVFAVQVDVGRFTDHRRAFYDVEWNAMPFSLLYPRPDSAVARPMKLDAMLHYAMRIGAEFPYMRVDLYELDGAVKFGETTFYPGAGLERFEPRSYDALFGAQWK